MRLALAIAVAGILVAPLVPSARAPPLVPFETWGVAKNSAGASLGINQPIRTFIDGVDYSNLTSTYNSAGAYQTQIAGNYYIGPSSETPMIKEGGDPNDPVMFAHGDLTTSGNVFQETAVWTTAAFQNLDLNEAAAGTQPALLKIQSVTTRPADGLTQYAYICNPSAAAVDLSKYYFQKDVPGSFAGPQVPLTGTVAAGQKIFADLQSRTYLNNNGDVLKLVYVNIPGPGSPNGGGNIIVDRVEFNNTPGGALTWEPGNTIMSDAPAPGAGQEIHRQTACTDTNQGSDFTLGPETTRPTAPIVAVVAPNGGERWTGGTPHAVTFTLSDAQDPNTALVVNITYSIDSGANYNNLIVSGRPGTNNPNSYSWTLPTIDTTMARILVCARDTTNLLACDASNADFTIDSTNPTVTGHTPTSGQPNVPVNQNVVVTFSELMDQPSVQNAFSLTPDPGGEVFGWSSNVLTVSHNPFNQGTVYQVVIGTGARDTSNPGLNLIPAVQWSFTTFQNNAPTVTVTAPVGANICWCGGFSHTISWNMNDVETNPSQLIVYVNYTSATAGNGPISGPLTGATTTTWIPMALNAPDVRIVVTVIDGGGASRADQSVQIRVDSTAPTVVTTTPSSGTLAVPKDQQITVVFSEAMNQTSVRNGFSILPIVAGLAFSWAGNTLAVTHSSFAPATQYTVTITGAKDDCAPGTVIGGGPYTFSFTTAANTLPVAAVTAPTAGAQFTPGQTILITWTMSDAETQPANLVVYLNYTSSAGNGAISTRLVGVTSYSWTAPGIDASDVKVVLTVIDEQGGSTTVPSGAFSIKSGGLDVVLLGGILAIILIAVIGALLYFLVFAKRRKKEQEAVAPPPARAPSAPRAPAARAPPPPPAAPGAPSAATKECPSCGTIIDAKDAECFMCGHKF